MDRTETLESTIKQIEKEHGKGAIMKMGDEADRMTTETISTGSLYLDKALGVGGLPKGRVTEIYGPEGSGKTTLAMHVVAEAQKAGGIGAIIDVENAMDPEYTERLGINLDELLISQPDSGEAALDIAERLIRSNVVDVIVLDSVAALVPQAEIDGNIGDSHVGLQARLMSQAMRKLSKAISTSNTVMIFINQIREKIGVMYGSPETTPGGRALKFYSSVRIDLRRKEAIKKGVDPVGNRVKAKVVKNKVAPPFKIAEFDLMFGLGISRTGEILDMAVENGIVDKKGAWFNYNETQLGQGRDNAKDALDGTMLGEEIEELVKRAIGLVRDNIITESSQEEMEDEEVAGEDAA